MERSKKFYSFLRKHLFVIKTILVLLLSCAAIGTAYLYGTTNKAVTIQANLMQVDQIINPEKATKQKFLHGKVHFDSVLTNKQQLEKSEDIMKRTLYQYRYKYANTYLVSSFGEETRLYKAETGITDLNWSNFSMVMVRNFYDGYLMENIALPLFKNFSKNGIRPKNENANFGAYISAKTAYKFVMQNGMLEKNNGDVAKAFDELISDDKFYFSVDCEKYPLNPGSSGNWKFTINNIYLTEEYSYLMDKATAAEESSKFRNFYKTFSQWNDECLLTYSEQIFVQGFVLNFDIAGSYFNYDFFLRNVVGSDYSENGMSLEFVDNNKNINQYAAEINKNSVSKDRINYIYLALSIALFTLLLLVFISMFKDIKNIKSKFLKVILYALPILPFIACQMFFHFFILLTSNIKTMYIIFNYVGNTIIILYLLVGLIFSLLWGVVDEDKTV